MQPFTILILTVFVCFSCASNDLNSQTSENKNLSSASPTKDREETIAPLEKEAREETCFITKITIENGQVFIHADYIQRLGGERAVEEAKKRGDADTAMIDGKMIIGLVNDYYIINDNPTIRKLPLDPAAKFELFVNPDRHEGKVTNTLQGLKLIYEETPFVLTLKNGRVTKVFEIFVP
jgi:hypothetical protein